MIWPKTDKISKTLTEFLIEWACYVNYALIHICLLSLLHLSKIFYINGQEEW